MPLFNGHYPLSSIQNQVLLKIPSREGGLLHVLISLEEAGCVARETALGAYTAGGKKGAYKPFADPEPRGSAAPVKRIGLPLLSYSMVRP